MRDLQITDDNTLTIWDPLAKAAVVFGHRSPTTDDRVRYMVGKYKRDGNRLIDRTRSALIDAACDVLTGIRPGDFSHGGRPLSSTPGEEGYREDWRELVRAAAGDLLFLMGHELFEGRLSLPDDFQTTIVSEFDTDSTAQQPNDSTDSTEGPIPPLAKSSGGSDRPAPRSARKSAPKPAGRR